MEISRFAIALGVAISVVSPRSEAKPSDDTLAETADDPKVQEAKQRYLRALELYQDGVYEAACLEFRKAHELAPTYKLFYNIAVCSQRINDFAEAWRYYQRYLVDGAAEITAERREFVEKQIELMATRVGKLRIEVNVTGAAIVIDEVLVGKSPLTQPVVVNSGRHEVSVSAPGKLPAARVVAVAGGDTVSLELRLSKPPAAVVGAEPSPVANDSGIATWPFWTATAVLGASAGFLTYRALGSKSELDDANGRLGVTQSEVDDARSKARRDALIADIFWGATAVAGGTALVISLTKPDKAEKRGVAVGVGAGHATVRGRF